MTKCTCAAPDYEAAMGHLPGCPLRSLARDWIKEPYGGVARQDRIGKPNGPGGKSSEPPGKSGPWCDKAWHLDGDRGPVLATAVLRCADCKRVYARCAKCNRGGDTVQVSMRAHIFACHRQNHALKRKVMPR